MKYLVFLVCLLLCVSVSFAEDVNATDTSSNHEITGQHNLNHTNMVKDSNNYEKTNTSNNLIKKTSISSSNSSTIKEASSTPTKVKKIYVNPKANVTKQDGSSKNPYTTIQLAVNKCLKGYNNIIILSQGNHLLTKTVQITKTISIVGSGKYKTNITCKSNQGFRMSAGANLTIEKLRMQNAYYSQGGAILAAKNTTLVINDAIFNKNSGNNGAVVFGSGGNIRANITNSQFNSNKAVIFGAALHLGGYGSIYNIDNCTFTKNILTDTNYSHSTGGAAVYASSYATVNINNSVFSANQALWGNAVLNGNHATLNVTNSKFTGNIAKNNSANANRTKGGAIAIGSGYAEIGNCYFYNNRADIGGAITVNSGESVLIYSTIFQTNLAYVHAGAINNYGTLTIRDCTFNNNNGNRRGGALVDIGNTEVIVENSTFNDNRVLTKKLSGPSMVPQGGAISISGSSTLFTIKNSVFNHNSAYYGGAIYSEIDVQVLTITNTLLRNNTSCFGGAIIVAGETTFNVENSSFNYNRALRKGGAILINGSSQGNFKNTNFTNNYVSDTNDGDGGVIHILCYARLGFSFCNFDNNYAKLRGGVICSVSGATVTITKSNITNNKATTGSAIYIDNSKSYKTQKSKIIIDTSIIFNNSGKYVLYSVKSYDATWNNNRISTSWWGSNVVPKNSTYNFNLKNYFLLTITIDNQVLNTNWVKNTITSTVNRTVNANRDLIVSLTTIKEGNILRYTDAFLPPVKFSIIENNKKYVQKELYVYYHLDLSLKKVIVSLNNQKITLNIIS